MRKALIPIFAVVGFLLALVVLPNTRWAVFSQWDVLMGRWEYNNGAGFTPEYGPWLQPRGTTEPTGKDSELLRLITPPPNQPSVGLQSMEERVNRLYKLVESKNEANYWAQFVRVASQVANLDWNQGNRYKEKPAELGARRRMREMLLRGCVAGGKLDPDNAFFSVVESAALYTLGRLPEARDAFLRASRGRSFNAYLRLEPELRLEDAEQANGYRGERIRAWVLANVLFYHYPAIRSVSKLYAKSEDPEMRAATARVGALMMRGEDSLIGIMVGRSVFATALRSYVPDPKDNKPLTTEEATQKAAALEAAVPGEQGIVQAAKSYIKLSSVVDEDWYPVPEDVQMLFNLGPAYAAWAFACLLSLGPLLGLAWLKSRSEQFGAAAPYLAWLLAIPLEPAFGIDQSHLWVAFGALLFLPALFPKSRKVADILGALWLVGALVAAGSESKLLWPVCFFIPAIVLTRWRWTLPTPVFGLTAAIAACATGLLWTLIGIWQGAGNGLFFGLFALLGTFSLAMAWNPQTSPDPEARQRRFLTGASVACVLVGVLYATYLFRELAANVRVAAAADALSHEADRRRSESGAY